MARRTLGDLTGQGLIERLPADDQIRNLGPSSQHRFKHLLRASRRQIDVEYERDDLIRLLQENVHRLSATRSRKRRVPRVLQHIEKKSKDRRFIIGEKNLRVHDTWNLSNRAAAGLLFAEETRKRRKT